MRSVLNVRRLDSAEYASRYAVARWSRAGYPVQLRQPQAQTRYLSFWAQGPQGLWRGMLDAHQWLDAVWPERSPLRPVNCDADDILHLFSAVARPLEIAPALIDYTRLFEIEVIDGELLPSYGLPCIQSAMGEVWVLNLPSVADDVAKPLHDWVLELQHVLSAVLGSSLVERSRYERLEPGDVVFIGEYTRQLFLAGYSIGQFTFIKEGLHMQLTPTETQLPAPISAVSDLPVKLEFIVGELTLSISQLNQLIESQVLPLAVEALSSVEVRVSGQCIARGELVQLDNRFGVELSEVYRGNADE